MEFFRQENSLKKPRFSEEKIIAGLKQAESGMKVTELMRKNGISEATFFNWKAWYGGLDVSQLRRLKELESENARSKKMNAELSLTHDALQDAVEKSYSKSRAQRAGDDDGAGSWVVDPQGVPGGPHGAATHVAWDSFTHATGLPVERSEFLQRELFRIGSRDIETYKFLQHASTLFGIVALAMAYRSWLKSGVAASAPPPGAQDTLRWWLLGSIAVLGAATGAAWVAAGILRGDSDMQSLVVAAVFVASNLIAVVYLAAAFIWRCVPSGRGSGDDPG